MIKNWVEQGFIFHAFMFIIISAHYTHSVHPPPPFLLGVGWASYQIFKKGALTGSKFLEGGCWEEGVNFFSESCSFNIKTN